MDVSMIISAFLKLAGFATDSSKVAATSPETALEARSIIRILLYVYCFGSLFVGLYLWARRGGIERMAAQHLNVQRLRLQHIWSSNKSLNTRHAYQYTLPIKQASVEWHPSRVALTLQRDEKSKAVLSLCATRMELGLEFGADECAEAQAARVMEFSRQLLQRKESGTRKEEQETLELLHGENRVYLVAECKQDEASTEHDTVACDAAVWEAQRSRTQPELVLVCVLGVWHRVQHAYESQGMCIVCMDEASSVLYKPCHHLATCFICSSQLDSCPICRKLISSRICIKKVMEKNQ